MKNLVIVSLSVALSVVSVDAAFSNTQPQKPEPPAVVQTEAETPLCYLQTPDGKTWNLDSLCEKEPKNANSARSRVAVTNPYNNAAIEKFDDDVYGENN